MSVAGRLGPVVYRHCVCHSDHITDVVNVDLCLDVFPFSLSFQFRIQLLDCLHLQYATVTTYMLLK